MRVWSIDLTNLILEVELESKVEYALILNDEILIGCYNGTVGTFNLKEKKF